MNRITLNDLTLREKIGQMALTQIGILTNLPDLEGYLKENPIGNVWHNCNNAMNAANLASLDEIDTPQSSIYYRELAKKISKMCKVPPFFGMDRPGKAQAVDLVDLPTQPLIGSNNSTEVSYKYGEYFALNARAVGANWIWSPYVDMPSRFSAVGIMRGFSDIPEKVVALADAYVQGAQNNNIVMTIKHFPGTDRHEYRDNHFVNTIINSSYEEWLEDQGKVFQELIDRGVYSVMIGHNAFPAIDDEKLPNGLYKPATLSYKIVTEELKHKMGFKGVVITDSIDMAAIESVYSSKRQMYVELINAGNDVLLNVRDLDFVDIVEAAVASGEISIERIDDACRRILFIKEKIGLFDDLEDIQMTEKLREEISAFSKKVAENGIVLECDRLKQLPLDKKRIKNITIICSCHYSPFFDSLKDMKEAFEESGINVSLQRRISSYEEMNDIAEKSDLIIYASYLMPHKPMGGSVLIGEECETFFYAFSEGSEKSIGVSLGSIYVYYDYYINMQTYLHTLSMTKESQRAFVAAIFGEIECKGEIPYYVPWK